jgi:hypothetical protein
MKRLFSLFIIIATCVTACEKSSTTDLVDQPSINIDEKLTGNWQLVSYFEDLGINHGLWQPAQQQEKIYFGADGSFSANEFWPWFTKNYNEYRVTAPNKIKVFSKHDGEDVFDYQLEFGGTLLLKRNCRVDCSRRYKRI